MTILEALRTVTESIRDWADNKFTARVATVTLPASAWTGDENPWSQSISVSGITINTKADLQPSAAQIVELQDAEISLMIENNDGELTCYALGNKPEADYTMQVLLQEVRTV